MALCLACGSGIHEKEDCYFRDRSREYAAQGIKISPTELREIDDAARGES